MGKLPSTYSHATCVLLLSFTTWAGLGQANQKLKLPPAALSPDAMIVADSVVTGQWPKTLARVNPPAALKDVSPGQCVRVAVFASGEDSGKFLQQPQIGFTVHFAGRDMTVAPTAAGGLKALKPEGGDFVQKALDAGGVGFEVPSTAAMAASGEKWCVPADAAAGDATVETVAVIGGERTVMKAVTLKVLSPENPGVSVLTDDKAVSEWTQTYYRHPEPVFLLGIIPSIFTHDAAANTLQQFVISAMTRDPAAVARLGPQLAKAEPQVQAMMVKLAKEAGVEMKISFTLSPMQSAFVEKLPDVPDAFDLTGNQELFGKQDQLWAMFSATGDRAPVDGADPYAGLARGLCGV